jgi:hypothetical protein
MLFKNCHREFIEINKYDFKNDKLYYKKIMELKQSIKENSAKLKKTFNDKDKQETNENSENITTD